MSKPSPSKYRYFIHDLTQGRETEIESDGPLPHLEVGHELNINLHERFGDGFSAQESAPLVITNVRLFLSTHKGNWTRYDVYVFCREQDSPVVT